MHFIHKAVGMRGTSIHPSIFHCLSWSTVINEGAAGLSRSSDIREELGKTGTTVSLPTKKETVEVVQTFEYDESISGMSNWRREGDPGSSPEHAGVITYAI